jgi:hypothetical protein
MTPEQEATLVRGPLDVLYAETGDDFRVVWSLLFADLQREFPRHPYLQQGPGALFDMDVQLHVPPQAWRAVVQREPRVSARVRGLVMLMSSK